jgi:hypothetical protein
MMLSMYLSSLVTNKTDIDCIKQDPFSYPIWQDNETFQKITHYNFILFFKIIKKIAFMSKY